MADALRCDGPGCGKVDTEPYLGWWRLESMALDQAPFLDFCSWVCMGAFVLDKSGDVAEMERRIADL